LILDTRRVAAWHTLEIGPLWVQRETEAQPGADAERVDHRSAAPAQMGADRSAPDVQTATMDWDELRSTVAACTRCNLCKTRKQTVFGVGSQSARWMLIGEAPGAEEDARGEPFVGQAGRLLDNMLAAVGLTRATSGEERDDQRVYIANVLKCRPPGNRNPDPAEVAQCEPYLQRQIALLRPRIIVIMGRFAAQSLLGADASIASMRGRVHTVVLGDLQIPAIVTYHPAYLLRNLADKAKSWADLCLAMETFENRTDAAGS
jgi:DNA polymerase